MEFRLSCVLVLIIFLCALVGCDMDDMQDMIRTSPKKYCGNHLVQALQTICRGNYNTIHKQDSYSNSYWDADYVSDMPSDGAASNFRFQRRAEAASMLGTYRTRRKRYAQGVYNECCQKTCTREELSSYCAVPYKRKR